MGNAECLQQMKLAGNRSCSGKLLGERCSLDWVTEGWPGLKAEKSEVTPQGLDDTYSQSKKQNRKHSHF